MAVEDAVSVIRRTSGLQSFGRRLEIERRGRMHVADGRKLLYATVDAVEKSKKR